MKLEKISLKEIESLYNNFLIHDFPENELKSLETIAKSVRHNQSECLILKGNGKILAYSILVWKKPEVRILEYLAVAKENRGQGIGRIMLQALFEYLDLEELIVESEDPDFVLEAEEKRISQKRLNFYEVNGFKQSGLKLKLGEVNFIIFSLYNQLTNEERLEEIREIYQITSPNMEILPY